MKYLKMLGLAAVAAMALMAVTASSVSATTLSIGGAAKTEKLIVQASLKSGTSAILKDTTGISSNTCTTSAVAVSTSEPYTGTSVTGGVTNLTFSSCAREPVTTDAGGTLHITWTSGTNGTVTSSGAEVTTGSPFGILNCKTGTGTHLGTLKGVASGNATMEFNAAISCSGISSKWEATYTVTTPGLGVEN